MEKIEISIKRIVLGLAICLLAIGIYAIPEFILNTKYGSGAFFGLAGIIILIFGSKILDSAITKIDKE